MAAETTTGFLIDGNLYEIPGVFTLTNDEAQILYDYTGLAIDDFLPGDEEAEPDFKNPALLRALMEIAYQRGNPMVRPAKVKELIGAANRLSVLSGLVGEQEPEEDDASPPALTSEPPGSSPKSSLENEPSKTPSTEKPGNDSTNGSDGPDSQPTPIGSQSSDSPAWVPQVSVS